MSKEKDAADAANRAYRNGFSGGDAMDELIRLGGFRQVKAEDLAPVTKTAPQEVEPTEKI